MRGDILQEELRNIKTSTRTWAFSLSSLNIEYRNIRGLQNRACSDTLPLWFVVPRVDVSGSWKTRFRGSWSQRSKRSCKPWGTWSNCPRLCAVPMARQFGNGNVKWKCYISKDTWEWLIFSVRPSPSTTCLQLMATATFSDRESAEKAVKTLHLGSQEVVRRSHLWFSFVSNHSFADQSGFVIRTVFKAWRGQPNRNCCSVEYKHCASEGLEKAYVEYAQLMSRIWKTLVAWTRRNMKTLPGFLIR